MTTEAISFEIKSQLAKLLATENITMRHSPDVSTAYFDIKNRLLVLPVWQNISEDLYDMLVVHEVGHALDTPLDAWESAIDTLAKEKHGDAASDKQKVNIKGFLNVIEDARIDKRQKRRYPGSKRNYVIGHKELFARDLYGINGKDVNDLTFIDRINLYFKGGLHLNIQFSGVEKSYLSRISNAETFDEVVALTSEIYSYSKEEKEEKLKKKQEIEEENSSDLDDSDYDFNEDSDDAESETSDDAESETSNEDEGNSSYADENAGVDDEDTVESVTEKNAQSSMDKMLANNSYIQYKYVTLPTFNYDLIVDDYKKVYAEMHDPKNEFKNVYLNSYFSDRKKLCLESFNEFMNAEKNSISYMVKEFEQKKAADTYSRIAVAKTGMLDTNKLHTYKYNEDIFRRISTVPEGKNHGFVMLLDWSGSMSYNLKNTLRHLFGLVMFCKKTQVPFEVYTFRSNPGIQKQYNSSELHFDNFKLRNILSSRMNTATLRAMMLKLWEIANHIVVLCDPLLSTPLNQAILCFDKIVNDFKSKHKVQVMNTIIITDGHSDPWRVTSSYDDYRKQIVYVFQDPLTKRTYYHDKYDGLSYYQTVIALKVLKERTGSNVIGFFLNGGNITKLNYMMQFSDAQKVKYRNDKFLGITNAGYDEYYIINISKLGIADEELDVSTNMTKNKIFKNFVKFSNKKSVNRIMLSKFVDRIAKNMQSAT